MPEKTLNVVYLGLNDFPFGLAETQKVRLTARGLIHCGCHVTLVSRSWSAMKWERQSTLSARGTFEGIEYVNASGFLYKPDSWLRRKILRVTGFVLELLTIFRLRRAGRLSVAILSTGSFWNVLWYRVLSKILGFPVIVHLVELYTSTLRNPGFFVRLSAFLFDRYVFTLVDGVLPISEHLVDRLRHYSPHKPWLKDPCLVDMSRFDRARRKSRERYFLFCGYLGHFEIIRFILDAFDSCTSNDAIYLYLVVNGSAGEFEILEKEMQLRRRKTQVRVYTNLRDDELMELYAGAYALLIPLRPTVQDAARFPHKIGEYCASGRPIVTTNYGEVRLRFTDHENAIIAPAYDVAAYAQALDDVLSNPGKAAEIGKNGRLLAAREFDYLAFGQRLKQFIIALIAMAEVPVHRDYRNDEHKEGAQSRPTLQATVENKHV